MPSWPAKDPHAVKDYSYAVPLDEGDSVTAMTFEKLSGDTVIDSDNSATSPATLVATLSGGTDGETSVFRVYWETAGGRKDDAVITQLALANESGEVTGYTVPRPADLIARFPAFAAVTTTTIAYWITDAQATVATDWIEADYRPAIVELAAHNMARQGLGTGGVGTGDMAGVTSFRSASFSVQFSESAVKASAAGGYASTAYGQDFAVRLRRNRGGPFLAGCARVC